MAMAIATATMLDIELAMVLVMCRALLILKICLYVIENIRSSPPFSTIGPSGSFVRNLQGYDEDEISDEEPMDSYTLLNLIWYYSTNHTSFYLHNYHFAQYMSLKHCNNKNYNEIHGAVVMHITCTLYYIFSEFLMPMDLHVCDMWLLWGFLHGFMSNLTFM